MHGAAAALAALALVAAAPSSACEAPAAGYARIESARFVVWMRTDPAPIDVGGEFSVAARVCAKGGDAAREVRFDAWMPAHRHGMNSKPSVARTADTDWRAAGFAFHMPGAWQFVIDIETGSGRDRLTHDIELR